MAAERDVLELWHPEAQLHSPTLRELAARVRARGGRVLGPQELCDGETSSPEVRSLAGVRLEVFLACDEVLREGQESPFGLNDGSLVVRLAYGRRSFLFTGDVELRGEQRLLAAFGPRLGSDVLKVAHHGSDTSSSEALLLAVSPQVGVISAGVRNSFDHPRRSVLERLERHGIVTLRTDLLGSVSASTDGQRLSIRTARQSRSPEP